MTTVKSTLDGAIQGRLEDAFGRAQVGDLLNALIKSGGAPQTIGTFRADDLAQGAAGVDMTYQGVDATSPTRVVAPRAGRIVGLALRANAAVTAQTITAAATIGGAANAQVATLDTSNQQVVQKFATPIPFAQGALLGIDISSGAGMTPDGSLEITADLIVEYGPSVEEESLVPSSNVATISTRASAILDVDALAGTTTGRFKLRKGRITGDQALVPASGEAIWDGNTKILFSASDAVTSVKVSYLTGSEEVASILQQDMDKIG